MIIPHDIDTKCIKTHRLDHHDTMLPILDWDPGVVHLASIDFGTLLGIVATCINIRLERLVSPAVM